MRFVGRFDCATPLNKIVKYNNKSEHIPKEHGVVRICFACPYGIIPTKA